MAALNKTQIAHARTRITAAKNAYIHRNMAAIGEEPDVQEYDDAQKLAMIRQGQAVLKAKYIDDDPYGHLTNFFTYADTPAMVEARAKLAVWEASKSGVTAKADAIEEQLIDELVMSPDGAAALARIAAAFA